MKMVLRKAIERDDEQIFRIMWQKIQPIMQKFKINVQKLHVIEFQGARGFNRNKGELIGVAMRDPATGNRRSYNENMRTLLHELAHSLTKQIGHGPEFANVWKKVLKEARTLGLYSGPTDSFKSAQEEHTRTSKKGYKFKAGKGIVREELPQEAQQVILKHHFPDESDASRKQMTIFYGVKAKGKPDYDKIEIVKDGKPIKVVMAQKPNKQTRKQLEEENPLLKIPIYGKEGVNRALRQIRTIGEGGLR